MFAVYRVEGLGFGNDENSWETIGVFGGTSSVITKVEDIFDGDSYTVTTEDNVIYYDSESGLVVRAVKEPLK